MLALASRGGWWLILLWMAFSFGVVATAYGLGHTSLLGKRANGTRDWMKSFVLWPYLAITRVVWELQILLSREEAYSVINESLILARRLRANEYPESLEVICDLTAELRDPKTICSRPEYRCFPILDAGAWSPSELQNVVDALKPAQGKHVLIHCANGHGRSGMVGCAWLIAHGFAVDAEEALKLIRAARPEVRLRPIQRRAVEQFAVMRMTGKNK